MSKSVYLSPGQLLEQEKWCLAPGFKSRDKAFPPVGQSHDPRSCSSSHLHTYQSTFCSHEQKASLHPGQVHTQPIGHFHDDTCWKWDNQTLRCRKKYLSYYHVDLVAQTFSSSTVEERAFCQCLVSAHSQARHMQSMLGPGLQKLNVSLPFALILLFSTDYGCKT